MLGYSLLTGGLSCLLGVPADGRHHIRPVRRHEPLLVSPYSWRYLYRSIDIRGLGFFDEENNVTGTAPDDIELRPVTYIRFH